MVLDIGAGFRGAGTRGAANRDRPLEDRLTAVVGASPMRVRVGS
jgi:hypothetical protein